ncbi:hypothetical protein SUGI_0026440 [Cryptomeria japonica]|nr:hypothetical protein SUGI_0026440 [Cryptomeria japonica]
MANTSVNRDTLVRKLSAFELEEFGPSRVVKSKPSFHAKELEDMKREDEEFEKFEALLARRVPKGPVGSVTDSDDEPAQDSTSSSRNGNEWVFLAIKEDDLVLEEILPEEKALAAKIEDKNEWVIDSGCSHHMTGDKRKFLSLQEFDGSLVKFGDDKACMIKGRGPISLDD